MEGNDVFEDIDATAFAIAALRAAESARPDRLFDDPYAIEFVRRAIYHGGGMEINTAITHRLHDSVAARTSYLDQEMQRAVASGIRQLVILGSGLDTRAFRLELPETTTCYELDLPKIIEFKERVLADLGAEPPINRVPVAADLAGDWMPLLTAAGFRPDDPSLWLLEGLLMYFEETQTDRLMTRIGEASAPASRLLIAHNGGGFEFDNQSRSIAASLADSGYPFRSALADPIEWCTRYGWSGTFTSNKRYAHTLGRALPYPEDEKNPVTWLGTAIRSPRSCSPS